MGRRRRGRREREKRDSPARPEGENLQNAKSVCVKWFFLFRPKRKKIIMWEQRVTMSVSQSPVSETEQGRCWIRQQQDDDDDDTSLLSPPPLPFLLWQSPTRSSSTRPADSPFVATPTIASSSLSSSPGDSNAARRTDPSSSLLNFDPPLAPGEESDWGGGGGKVLFRRRQTRRFTYRTRNLLRLTFRCTEKKLYKSIWPKGLFFFSFSSPIHQMFPRPPAQFFFSWALPPSPSFFSPQVVSPPPSFHRYSSGQFPCNLKEGGGEKESKQGGKIGAS